MCGRIGTGTREIPGAHGIVSENNNDDDKIIIKFVVKHKIKNKIKKKERKKENSFLCDKNSGCCHIWSQKPYNSVGAI